MTTVVAATTVRPMRWTDIDEVHQIERRAFPGTAWSAEAFWSELAGVPESRAYWVAMREGQVVGYTGLHTMAPDADIQTLAVEPGSRRTGVARALLATLVEEARVRGCRTLMLEVDADNAPARVLYQAHHFERVARRASYYGPGRDAIVMRLVLQDDDPGTRG
jgi:ribosomal-protein-alanine N-acetyltransferase